MRTQVVKPLEAQSDVGNAKEEWEKGEDLVAGSSMSDSAQLHLMSSHNLPPYANGTSGFSKSDCFEEKYRHSCSKLGVIPPYRPPLVTCGENRANFGRKWQVLFASASKEDHKVIVKDAAKFIGRVLEDLGVNTFCS